MVFFLIIVREGARGERFSYAKPQDRQLQLRWLFHLFTSVLLRYVVVFKLQLFSFNIGLAVARLSLLCCIGSTLGENELEPPDPATTAVGESLRSPAMMMICDARPFLVGFAAKARAAISRLAPASLLTVRDGHPVVLSTIILTEGAGRRLTCLTNMAKSRLTNGLAHCRGWLREKWPGQGLRTNDALSQQCSTRFTASDGEYGTRQRPEGIYIPSAGPVQALSTHFPPVDVESSL